MTLDLRGHFTEFRAAQPGRIHLAAHSHHFWPDAACDAHRRALADAARLADNKWEMIFGELIPRAQRGVARILALPDPATIAFAPNTHDFVCRLISALLAGDLAREGMKFAVARENARRGARRLRGDEPADEIVGVGRERDGGGIGQGENAGDAALRARDELTEDHLPFVVGEPRG